MLPPPGAEGGQLPPVGPEPAPPPHGGMAPGFLPGGGSEPWEWREGESREAYCARLADCANNHPDPYIRDRCYEVWLAAFHSGLCGWLPKPPPGVKEEKPGFIYAVCPKCAFDPCEVPDSYMDPAAKWLCDFLGAEYGMPSPFELCAALHDGDEMRPCRESYATCLDGCASDYGLGVGMEALLRALRLRGLYNLANLIQTLWLLFKSGRGGRDILQKLIKLIYEAIKLIPGLGTMMDMVDMFKCMECCGKYNDACRDAAASKQCWTVKGEAESWRRNPDTGVLECED